MVTKKEYILKFLEVLLAFGIVVASFFAVFWLVFRSEWSGEYNMMLKDPFSGFAYCVNTEVETVEVVDIVHTLRAKDGCLEIPDSFWGMPVTSIYIWEECSVGKIHTIKIPDSVIRIKRMQVRDVEEIEGGENVREIYPYAFENLEELQRFVLGNYIEEINEGAFAGCVKLKDVNLGECLQGVKTRTFSGCTSLETIRLGYNVTSVGEEAFAGCTSLKEVSKTVNVQYIGDNAFQDTPWAETVEGKTLISAY